MDQTARIEDGSGNIIVQAVASRVTLGLPPQLKLLPRHRRKRAPKPGVDIDLLNPFTDAIPFIGREKDLGRLQAWLATPKPISARCLIGRAGAGKTRLALQICELAEAQTPAWDAGFVEHRELERFATQQNLSAWGWQRPTLIVVDYAAGVTRWLRPWLEELAENPATADGPPLRLLLLERFADPGIGWWENLTSAGQSNAGLPDLFDPPKPEELWPVATKDHGALLAAIETAAGKAEVLEPESHRLRHPRACPGDPWIAGTGRSSPAMTDEAASDQLEALDLLMAGLIAARQLVPAEGGRPWSRTAMATGLARHERSRIERLARDRNVSSATLEHLVAVVTLSHGIVVDDARPMIEAELAALPRCDSGSALDLRDVLIDALREKQTQRIPPVVPDLIGEAFVLDAFSKLTPTEQAEIVIRSYRRSPETTVATVIRTAQDFADGEQHPSLRWLDELMNRSTDLPALIQLATAFPAQATPILHERAALVTGFIAEYVRKLPIDPQNSSIPILRATMLYNLSIHLTALGRRDEALSAALTSARIYRDVAQECPAAFLALSLRNLATMLSHLGRREEALAAIEEEVAIRREEAELQPNALHPELARSLNNLARSLSEVGRREEALAAIEEAVAIRRELAALRPDAFRPDLAISLNNLARSLSDLGRREEALEAIEEAVAIHRELAALRPDAFRPDLAMSLNNLATSLSDLGRPEEALSAAGEAVAIYRELAALQPDTFRPNLARSLNTLANKLSNRGRPQEALATAEEAVAIRRELALLRPDAFRTDLAESLSTLARSLSDLGRREEALSAIEEAVAIDRELALLQPDAFRPDLAGSLNNLAISLSDLGRPEEALSAAGESVAIYGELAALRSDAFRPDLAQSLAVLGNCLEATGRLDQALARGREALVILLPYLQRWPKRFVEPMYVLSCDYLRRCEAAGIKPDMELLAPVAEVFQRLQGVDAGALEEHGRQA